MIKLTVNVDTNGIIERKSLTSRNTFEGRRGKQGRRGRRCSKGGVLSSHNVSISTRCKGHAHENVPGRCNHRTIINR